MLRRSTIGLHIYSRTMGKNMLKLFQTHAEQITKNTSIKFEEMHKLKYLHEFDRAVQCASWGYPTVGAYYRDASSADSVLSIRIPVLAIHATDDPIAHDAAVPYEEFKQSPYVVMCATNGGGHLGWFELGGGRWHMKPAVGFLNAMKDVDFNNVDAPEVAKEGPHGGHQTPFVFEPMRRKSYRAQSEQ